MVSRLARLYGFQRIGGSPGYNGQAEKEARLKQGNALSLRCFAQVCIQSAQW